MDRKKKPWLLYKERKKFLYMETILNFILQITKNFIIIIIKKLMIFIGKEVKLCKQVIIYKMKLRYKIEQEFIKLPNMIY